MNNPKKEDVSMPRATILKIIKEMLPPEARVSQEAQALFMDCCVEFINLVSSEANEICNKDQRKTIAPEHVLQSLGVLGFSSYIAEVRAAYEQHKADTQETPRNGTRNKKESSMSEEEAIAEQQRMFAEARAQMNNGRLQ